MKENKPATFWGWSFGKKDNPDQELIQACALYRRRFKREVAVVFVHPELATSLGRSHLVVLEYEKVPKNAFYFTVPEGS